MEQHDNVKLHQILLDHAKAVTQHVVDTKKVVDHELSHDVESASPKNVSGH